MAVTYLTWFILTRKAERGEIGSGFVQGLAGKSRTGRFYAATIAATLIAGAVYFVLWKGIGMPQDRSYYVVVLSFLLIHYFYDHILFREFAPVEGPGLHAPAPSHFAARSSS